MAALMTPTLRASPHSFSIGVGIGIGIGTLRRSFLAFLAPRRCQFQVHPNLSFKREERFIGVNKTWSPAFAFESNKNTSEGSKELRESSGAAQGQGPPLLTILAGLLVFLLFCWIIGLLATWILGFIRGN